MADKLTIKEAIQILEDEGYIVLDRHTGLVVSPSEIETPKETPYCYPEHIDNSYMVIR